MVLGVIALITGRIYAKSKRGANMSTILAVIVQRTLDAIENIEDFCTKSRNLKGLFI